LVWGRPISTGGISPSNPNGQVTWTGVVPGTVTSTGATLRTYVYEVWTIDGQYIGWYPRAPQQASLAYAVVGEPQPLLPPFTVTANAPSYVTVKAYYDLLGSASDPATDWRWDRSDDDQASWYTWEYAQNSGFIAYPGDGEYKIDWRLFARRTADSETAYGYSATTVCIDDPICPMFVEPELVNATAAGALASEQSSGGTPAGAAAGPVLASVGAVQVQRHNSHFGSGAWV